VRPAAARPTPAQPEPPIPAPPVRPSRPRLGLTGIAAVVVLCVCAVLAAVLEVLLVPLYVGSALVPITLLLAALTMVGIPFLIYDLARSLALAGLPVLLWAVTIIVLSSSRPEGDVLLPGGGGVQIVSYALLLGGVAVGVTTLIVLASGPSWLRRRDYRAVLNSTERAALNSTALNSTGRPAGR
jgi:hypothetical protein